MEYDEDEIEHDSGTWFEGYHAGKDEILDAIRNLTGHFDWTEQRIMVFLADKIGVE